MKRCRLASHSTGLYMIAFNLNELPGECTLPLEWQWGIADSDPEIKLTLPSTPVFKLTHHDTHRLHISGIEYKTPLNSFAKSVSTF